MPKRKLDASVKRGKPVGSTGLPYNQAWPTFGKFTTLVTDELASVLTEVLPLRDEMNHRRKLLKRDAESLTGDDREFLQRSFYLYSVHVTIGVNCVMKALERAEGLALVLVSGAAGIAPATRHILCLSLLRGVPVAFLDNLSELVSPLFGIKSAAVLAFKVSCDSPFSDLIQYIVDKIPNVEAPWLESWKKTHPLKNSSEMNVPELGQLMNVAEDKYQSAGSNTIDANAKIKNSQVTEAKRAEGLSILSNIIDNDAKIFDDISNPGTVEKDVSKSIKPLENNTPVAKSILNTNTTIRTTETKTKTKNKKKKLKT